MEDPKIEKTEKKVRRLPIMAVRLIFIAGILLGIVCACLGGFGSLRALLYVGMGLLCLSGVFYVIFYRCPHCKQSLDRTWTKDCPHCGKHLD